MPFPQQTIVRILRGTDARFCWISHHPPLRKVWIESRGRVYTKHTEHCRALVRSPKPTRAPHVRTVIQYRVYAQWDENRGAQNCPNLTAYDSTVRVSGTSWLVVRRSVLWCGSDTHKQPPKRWATQGVIQPSVRFPPPPCCWSCVRWI